MVIADKETARQMNVLARKQMIHRLLADIMMDISICQLEGYNYKEYIEELKEAIDHIADKGGIK